MTKRAWIDFETYSELDLKKAGGMAYALHGSTNPICLAYALDDDPVQLWTPRDPDPTDLLNAISNGALVYAHKLIFDYRIWMYIMTRDFEWPEIDLDQCVDTMGLCATYGLPLNLADAGSAMNIKMQKESIGKALIKVLCNPNKRGGQPMWNDPVYQAKFRQFFAYAKRDVEAMRELVMEKLPRSELIPQEHPVWKLTFNMNNRGLPIAYDEAKAIRERLNIYIEKSMVKIPKLTNNAIQKVTQTIKIKEWICDQGYEIPDLTANTVEEALEDPKCTGKVRRMLELRQELGKSSVAKFNKILEQAVPDEDGNYRIYDNLEFHGAGPGRWAARGFQMHNLPRFKLKDPEVWIDKFINNEPIEDPVGMAKGLIRPMIKAPKILQVIVLDYDSIENKVLHWLADDQEAIADFNAGVDQYITMASERYKEPYDIIKEGHLAGDSKYSGMRFMGKVIILGSGFGMGADTFVVTAKQQFGMTVSDDEAYESIQAYRNKYVKVKKLWNDLKVAAVRAVLTGKRQTVRRITFGLSVVKGIPWLAMRLPSGKCVYYCKPTVEARFIPKHEYVGKVPTIIHHGRHPKTGKWVRIPLIPGRITENAVQGTAREIMARGLLNVEERVPEITPIGTVHDEGISIIHKKDITDKTLDIYKYHLCDIPWADGCPISASGYIATRYKKD